MFDIDWFVLGFLFNHPYKFIGVFLYICFLYCSINPEPLFHIMNTKIISYIWCFVLLICLSISMYLLFGCMVAGWKVFFVFTLSMIPVLYSENIVHKIYRMLYIPSENYENRCKLSKKYQIPTTLIILGLLFFLKMYIDTHQIHFLMCSVILIPVTVHVLLHLFLYRYQVQNCIHAGIIHDSCLFLNGFKWFLSSVDERCKNQYRIDDDFQNEYILLVCYCKHLSINMFTRFLKSKLKKRGYRVSLDLNNYNKIFAQKNKRSQRYTIFIEQTDQEYVYELHILSSVR